MSTTAYGVNDSLSNKLWAKKLSAEALKETYFGKFMGTGSDNMIHVKNETSTNAGDAVTFGLRMQLAGDGVTESQTLQGNEEPLIDLFRQGDHQRARPRGAGQEQELDRRPAGAVQPARRGQDGAEGLVLQPVRHRDVQPPRRQHAGDRHALRRQQRHRRADVGIYRGGGATDDATINADNTKVMNLQVIDALVETRRRRHAADPADQGQRREQVPDVPARLPGDGPAHLDQRRPVAGHPEGGAGRRHRREEPDLHRRARRIQQRDPAQGQPHPDRHLQRRRGADHRPAARCSAAPRPAPSPGARSFPTASTTNGSRNCSTTNANSASRPRPSGA